MGGQGQFRGGRHSARLLTGHYVFPEIAEQLAGLLRRRLAEGAYDVDGAEELARLVTADLQPVNGDRHLRLEAPRRPGIPEAGVTGRARRGYGRQPERRMIRLRLTIIWRSSWLTA
ncbi:hypothetical protein ABZ951_15300 [Streptomyces sp. NPDC046215]|uniref:hypothetical protein n=1 Tax=Streptomyces TaxID=1883 RepID=UPI0031E40D31